MEDSSSRENCELSTARAADPFTGDWLSDFGMDETERELQKVA
jgi:hypothetical protein